jgi:osmotically-inducible protein OsmY
MKFIKYIVWAGIALIFSISFAACDQPGPAESTGKKIDETTEKTGEVIGDSAITAKVKAAILAEPGLRSLQISVDTTQGMVMLSGAVDSQQDIDKAEQVASAVAGVKSVKNRLTLK